MKAELTRGLAQELMKIKGETRGFNIKNDGDYIVKMKGEKALEKVEQELEKVGYPIKYKELKDMGFYPAGFRALSLLAIKKALNFNDQDIKELCTFLPKISLMVKVFSRYFYSPETLLEQSPKIWKVHWTFGELGVKEFSLEKKCAILVLEDFELHPVFCRCLEGYFESMTKMVVKSEGISCQETKCTLKRKGHHEFLIEWE